MFLPPCSHPKSLPEAFFQLPPVTEIDSGFLRGAGFTFLDGRAEFGRFSEAIITGYKTMVRPIIEYACPVWNPHQAYLSDKLERIQRNVSRWILGGPIDYTERLQYLGWMELKSRREYLSIIQLFKFINGFSRVKLDNYLSFSRASTRSRNSSKIWKPFSRTNILKFSFWHRYIDKWNSLPDSLICADSLSKFKKGLREHFLN